MRKSSRCFVRNPTLIAGAISEPSAGYGPGSSAYSPSLSAGQEATGRVLIVVQPDNPQSSAQGTPAPSVPRPPLASVGGVPGRARPYGYTEGILPSRNFRQHFRGAILVRANMGANPVVGPVGLSNRQGRLQGGVKALVTDYLPDSQTVREGFTQPQAATVQAPRNRNPLAAFLNGK